MARKTKKDKVKPKLVCLYDKDLKVLAKLVKRLKCDSESEVVRTALGHLDDATR